MAENRSFESTLYDIVYSIDAGTGLKIIRGGLYILVLLLIVMVYTATQFRGLKTEESMDYAQLGRNLASEQKLTTKYVRPLSMWKMASLGNRPEAQVMEHPDLYHPPAYPFVLASGFKLFELFGIDPFEVSDEIGGLGMPAEKWVVLPVNHIFSMLTGLLIFLMGRRVFSREIGLFGMSIYFLSDLVWRDSISGLNLSMAVFFIVGAYYFMLTSMLNKRDGDSRSRWLVPFLLSIVFAAIAFLTRYIAIAVVPGLCLFAWLMSGRFRGGTRFVLVFIFLYILLISPWMVRNYRICGNPMGMAGYTVLAETSLFPDDSLVRNYNPEFSFNTSSAVVKEKWLQNYSGKFSTVIPSMGGGILMAIFLTTFFYHFIRPQVNYLRWGIGLSLILTVIIGGYFSESSILMIHAFWPFVILYALAFFYILIDRLDLGVRLYNLGLKVLIGVLATLPFWLAIMPPHERAPNPPYFIPIISQLSDVFEPHEVLCSDMPWATAWYGDLTTVLLPKNLEQFDDIVGYQQYISGIYITPITKNKPFLELVEGGERDWLGISLGNIPPDFLLTRPINFIQGSTSHFLLTDVNRFSRTGASSNSPEE